MCGGRKAERVGESYECDIMDLRTIFKDEPPFDIIYLNDLAEAIKCVDRNYCKWSYDNLQAASKQTTERVFAYELFHQFRSLTDKKAEYSDLRFDAEIGKMTEPLVDCRYFKLNGAISQIRFSPDLLLHKSQNDKDIVNQKLIIELKTRAVSDQELYKTILKLNHYLKILNYQYAVFVNVNMDFDQLINRLKRVYSSPIHKECTRWFNRIIIMNYNSDKLTIDSLLSVYNSIQ